MWICICIGVFVLSVVITGFYRRYALARALMDIPNNRSSHTVPTPRGGGIAIVASFILALILFRNHLNLSITQLLGYVIPGLLLAVISYIDDLGHVQPRWRLLTQVVAASIGIALMGGMTSITLLGIEIKFLLLISIALIFLLVWLINLYNFMDGIDGIASLEAIAVCIGLALITLLVLPERNEIFLPLLLMAATAGFLCWNFPKAKIFMGDIGSCFLGIEIGLFAVHFSHYQNDLFWCVFILLGTFMVDATITLMRRFWRGEKIYMAHREHAYQHAARRLNSHPVVSIVYFVVTLCWLLPVAVCVALSKLDGLIGILIAYIPLAVVVWRLRAGLANAL